MIKITSINKASYISCATKKVGVITKNSNNDNNHFQFERTPEVEAACKEYEKSKIGTAKVKVDLFEFIKYIRNYKTAAKIMTKRIKEQRRLENMKEE